MKPFAVVSDRHFHNWSAFSGTLPGGVNSRLQLQLDEMERVASEVRKAGGDTIIDCGDTFHVRGNVAPSVLNPVADLHARLVATGIKIFSMPGNHDCEAKEAHRVSNAITALEGVGVNVIHAAGLLDGVGYFIPWTPDLKVLKGLIEDAHSTVGRAYPEPVYLFLHAPLNGVIVGLPDIGLEPAWLAGFGFKGVFVGHFHNNKEFPGNVWSVGATCHQTWSDIGTKAGFLIVSDEGVKWHASHAPKFIDLNASLADPSELPLLVDGNYVRAKIETSDLKEIDDLRNHILASGAEGVIINAVRTAAATPRAGATISAGASMEVSVADFVRSRKYAAEAAVLAECGDILATAVAA